MQKTDRSPVRRIRTLIADDEPLARDLVCSLVRRDPDLELVGAAASGAETLRLVEQLSPDLLLLDIQMPNLDGISVAEQLAGSRSAPYVIYVTAHDRFALKAFEVAVRDYLVKPVGKQRFAAAIRRAKAEISENAPRRSAEDPIVVRDGEAVVCLLPDDIVWVEAANQYVCLHSSNGRDFIVSRSLRQFGATLPEHRFTRIHRSTLINRRHVREVLKAHGRSQVRLSDQSIHDIARSRRAMIPELLTAARDNR